MLEDLEPKTWLELNAKLQAKKNFLRKLLGTKGVLKRGAQNDYDHYKYFSEAQYKELFTELFSDSKLELKFNELSYDTFDGTGNQKNGRRVKLEFKLTDCETGFYETTTITGEALDKGDKAGYKAYTGALKYYLADTFMVATGDDPEKDSPEGKTVERKIEPEQVEVLKAMDPKLQSWVLKKFRVEKLEDLTEKQATWFISQKAENDKKKEEKQ